MLNLWVSVETARFRQQDLLREAEQARLARLSRRPGTEDRRPRTENRRLETADRRPRTEDRGLQAAGF